MQSVIIEFEVNTGPVGRYFHHQIEHGDLFLLLSLPYRTEIPPKFIPS